MGNVTLLIPEDIPHFIERRLNQVAITTEGEVTCPRFMNLYTALYQCNHAGTDFCIGACPHHSTLGLTSIEAEAIHKARAAEAEAAKGATDTMNSSDAPSTVLTLNTNGEWKVFYKAHNPKSLDEEYDKKLKEIQKKRKGGVRLRGPQGEIVKEHVYRDGKLQTATQPTLF